MIQQLPWVCPNGQSRTLQIPHSEVFTGSVWLLLLIPSALSLSIFQPLSSSALAFEPITDPQIPFRIRETNKGFVPLPRSSSSPSSARTHAPVPGPGQHPPPPSVHSDDNDDNRTDSLYFTAHSDVPRSQNSFPCFGSFNLYNNPRGQVHLCGLGPTAHSRRPKITMT